MPPSPEQGLERAVCACDVPHWREQAAAKRNDGASGGERAKPDERRGGRGARQRRGGRAPPARGLGPRSRGPLARRPWPRSRGRRGAGPPPEALRGAEAALPRDAAASLAEHDAYRLAGSPRGREGRTRHHRRRAAGRFDDRRCPCGSNAGNHSAHAAPATGPGRVARAALRQGCSRAGPGLDGLRCASRAWAVRCYTLADRDSRDASRGWFIGSSSRASAGHASAAGRASGAVFRSGTFPGLAPVGGRRRSFAGSIRHCGLGGGCPEPRTGTVVRPRASASPGGRSRAIRGGAGRHCARGGEQPGSDGGS